MGLLSLLGSSLIKANVASSPDAPERTMKAWQVDPFSYMDSVTHRERPASLGYEQLRSMAQRCDIINAIVQTRVSQVASFSEPQPDKYSIGYAIVMRDPQAAGSSAAARHIAEVTQMVQSCGLPGMAQDNFETFLRKITRDSLIYDQFTAEIVPRNNGLPAFFEAVDASTIRFASQPMPQTDDNGSKSGSLDKPKARQQSSGPFQQAMSSYMDEQLVKQNGIVVPAKYVQLINGTVRAKFTEDELYFGVRNPRTDLNIMGYGMSELEVLIGIVTSYLYAEDYNRRNFSQGCLAGDTLLHTEAGLLSVQDVFLAHDGLTRQLARASGEDLSEFTSMGRIWNGQEFVEFDVTASGMLRACRTALEDGSSVTTSPNHKFITLREGKMAQVEWSNLRVGDVLPQSRSALSFSAAPDTSCSETGQYGGKEFHIDAASPDLWEVLGWMVGDGCFNRSFGATLKSGAPKMTPSFSLFYAQGEEEIMARHRAILEDLGVPLPYRQNGGQWGKAPLHTLTGVHATFYRYVRDTLGMTEGTAPFKRIPKALFCSGPAERAAFVRGLFGADGHVKSVRKGQGAKTSYLTSTSRALIDDTQQILWSLGIASAVEHVMSPGDYRNGLKHELWRLRVRDGAKFTSEVGFASPHKTDDERTSGYADRRAGGTVPLALRQRIAQTILTASPDLAAFSSPERVALRALSQDVYSDPKFNRGAVSRTRLLDWCHRLDITEFDEALSYRWVTITELTDTGLDVLMFDVRQQHNKHQYSVGSCITANSVPKGIINLKGEITDQQMAAFRREWNALIAGTTNSWKTPIINAEDMEYINLQGGNKDMEYMQWMQFLVRVACFTPDTPVVLADGRFQTIDTVEPGMVVRTHSGRTGVVKNVQITRGDHQMVGIKAGGEIIRATVEHPFYAASSVLESSGARVIGEPEWVRAEDIVGGRDYLLIPKPKGEAALTTSCIDLATHIPEYRASPTEVRPNSNRSYAIPRFLELTEENAFVLGLFVAEGHANDYAVTFAFHALELDYADAVHAFAARLGLHAEDWTADGRENSLVLRIRSAALSRAFRAIAGPLAPVKRVPEEILSAPLSVQQAFLSGLIGGDGCVPTEERGRVTVQFSTSSDVLSRQVQSMLLWQGVYSARYSRIRRSGYKPGTEEHSLRISGGFAQKMAAWMSGPKGAKLRDLVEAAGEFQPHVYETEGYFYVPVTETWEEKYSGPVYNLEVEGEHTYQVAHFAVHNCACFLIDPAEINFDMPRGLDTSNPMIETGNEAKLRASKDRGLAPLLRTVQRSINEMFVYRLDSDFEFRFMGLNAPSLEQDQATISTSMGWKTLNEVRAVNDLAPVQGGDIVMSPIYLQAMQMQMEQAQIDAASATQIEQHAATLAASQT